MATNSNEMSRANELVDSINTVEKPVKVKYIKKDNGLLERENLDDEKIILSEDNRQVLFG